MASLLGFAYPCRGARTLGFSILGNVNKVFHGNLASDANGSFTTTKLKGRDQGRVNITTWRLFGPYRLSSERGDLTTQ